MGGIHFWKARIRLGKTTEQQLRIDAKTWLPFAATSSIKMLISSAKSVHSSMEGERWADSFRLGNQKEADRRSAKRPMGPRESPRDIEIQIRISKRKGAMPFGFLLE